MSAKTLADIERDILEKIVEKYEKKGGGETSVAVTTVYKRYNDISEPVQNTEWFENAVASLEKKSLVKASRKNRQITRIKLNISELEKASLTLERDITVKKDGRKLLSEDGLCGEINKDYYTAHPSDYLKEREYVIRLSGYLSEHADGSEEPAAERERCFQIWQEEKMLTENTGENVLRHCSIPQSRLNTYKTYEPIPYRSFTDSVPQSILFVENSATYCTIVKMKKEEDMGVKAFGKEFGTVVYGGGQRILGQIEGWKEPYVESYLTDKRNRFYYFGDLDRSGIQIFLALENMFHFSVIPLKEAYVKMAEMMLACLDEKKNGKKMPEKQIKTSITGFEKYFSTEEWDIIVGLLNNGYLIPQEILTKNEIGDWEERQYDT